MKRNCEPEQLAQDQKIPTLIGTLTLGQPTTNIKSLEQERQPKINKHKYTWTVMMKFNEHGKQI